jgi:hypothetical protein
MADQVLFIGWGTPARGREERGLEVFNEAMGFYGRMQQEGRIESFDVVLLTPNARLDGYIQLHGSAEQLAGARADAEFQRILTDANLTVDDLFLVDGYANEGVARQMAIYQDALAKVPQNA